MARFFTVLVFLLVFCGFLVAGLPASLVARQLGLRASGIDYMRVSGTLWSGKVAGLNIAGEPLGDARFDLKPSALVSGALAYDVALDGGVLRARGGVELPFDRRLVIRDLVADVDLDQLGRLDARLRQSPARLSLTIATLEMTADGACAKGDGQVRTDLLETAGPRWNWEGPQLGGTLDCREGLVHMQIGGETQSDAITASASFDARSSIYHVGAQVRSQDTGVMQALHMLDFEAQDGVFVYSMTNDPRAATEKELHN